MVNFATGCKAERKTIVYESGSALSIIYSDDTYFEVIKSFSQKLNQIRGGTSKIVKDDIKQSKFEIVVGVTNREVSKKAHEKLNEFKKESNEYLSYVLYCGTNCLAIAYDQSTVGTDIILNAALSKFLNSYAVRGSLVLNEGFLESGTINIVEEQRKADNVEREKQWQTLNTRLTSKYGATQAQETISALKELYACYNTDVIYWLANLYDVNAGFYYSNSGRDSKEVVYSGKTIQFGSDFESTDQIFNLLQGFGVFEEFSNNIKDGLPEEFGKHIALWVKSLQSPNGYFYHPQWEAYYIRENGVIVNDSLPATRRSRDLSRAINLLDTFGYLPTYDTPNGRKGDGVIVNLSSENYLNKSTQIQLLSEEENVSNDINDNLTSAESLTLYLDTIIGPNIRQSNQMAYSQSNFLNTQIGIIKGRDLELDPTGETKPLTTALINWLNEFQDQTSGLWINPANGLDFNAINGAFKIVSIYQAVQAPCPNADKTLESCLRLLKFQSVSKFSQVVYLYNIWNAMDLIIKNVNWYHPAEDRGVVADIRSKIISDSVVYILKSREVIKQFMKADGSSSYNIDSSSYTSQNVQVAIKNTNEGDVNATAINLRGILICMTSVLDITKINPFGEAERIQFILALERQQPIVKK